MPCRAASAATSSDTVRTTKASTRAGAHAHEQWLDEVERELAQP
jgi:hypothetical protein